MPSKRKAKSKDNFEEKLPLSTEKGLQSTQEASPTTLNPRPALSDCNVTGCNAGVAEQFPRKSEGFADVIRRQTISSYLHQKPSVPIIRGCKKCNSGKSDTQVKCVCFSDPMHSSETSSDHFSTMHEAATVTTHSMFTQPQRRCLVFPQQRDRVSSSHAGKRMTYDPNAPDQVFVKNFDAMLQFGYARYPDTDDHRTSDSKNVQNFKNFQSGDCPSNVRDSNDGSCLHAVNERKTDGENESSNSTISSSNGDIRENSDIKEIGILSALHCDEDLATRVDKVKFCNYSELCSSSTCKSDTEMVQSQKSDQNGVVDQDDCVKNPNRLTSDRESSFSFLENIISADSPKKELNSEGCEVSNSPSDIDSDNDTVYHDSDKNHLDNLAGKNAIECSSLTKNIGQSSSCTINNSSQMSNADLIKNQIHHSKSSCVAMAGSSLETTKTRTVCFDESETLSSRDFMDAGHSNMHSSNVKRSSFDSTAILDSLKIVHKDFKDINSVSDHPHHRRDPMMENVSSDLTSLDSPRDREKIVTDKFSISQKMAGCGDHGDVAHEKTLLKHSNDSSNVTSAFFVQGPLNMEYDSLTPEKQEFEIKPPPAIDQAINFEFPHFDSSRTSENITHDGLDLKLSYPSLNNQQAIHSSISVEERVTSSPNHHDQTSFPFKPPVGECHSSSSVDGHIVTEATNKLIGLISSCKAPIVNDIMNESASQYNKQCDSDALKACFEGKPDLEFSDVHTQFDESEDRCTADFCRHTILCEDCTSRSQVIPTSLSQEDFQTHSDANDHKQFPEIDDLETVTGCKISVFEQESTTAIATSSDPGQVAEDGMKDASKLKITNASPLDMETESTTTCTESVNVQPITLKSSCLIGIASLDTSSQQQQPLPIKEDNDTCAAATVESNGTIITKYPVSMHRLAIPLKTRNDTFTDSSNFYGDGPNRRASVIHYDYGTMIHDSDKMDGKLSIDNRLSHLNFDDSPPSSDDLDCSKCSKCVSCNHGAKISKSTDYDYSTDQSTNDAHQVFKYHGTINPHSPAKNESPSRRSKDSVAEEFSSPDVSNSKIWIRDFAISGQNAHTAPTELFPEPLEKLRPPNCDEKECQSEMVETHLDSDKPSIVQMEFKETGTCIVSTDSVSFVSSDSEIASQDINKVSNNLNSVHEPLITAANVKSPSVEDIFAPENKSSEGEMTNDEGTLEEPSNAVHFIQDPVHTAVSTSTTPEKDRVLSETIFSYSHCDMPDKGTVLKESTNDRNFVQEPLHTEANTLMTPETEDQTVSEENISDYQNGILDEKTLLDRSTNDHNFVREPSHTAANTSITREAEDQTVSEENISDSQNGILDEKTLLNRPVNDQNFIQEPLYVVANTLITPDKEHQSGPENISSFSENEILDEETALEGPIDNPNFIGNPLHMATKSSITPEKKDQTLSETICSFSYYDTPDDDHDEQLPMTAYTTSAVPEKEGPALSESITSLPRSQITNEESVAKEHTNNLNLAEKLSHIIENTSQTHTKDGESDVNEATNRDSTLAGNCHPNSVVYPSSNASTMSSNYGEPCDNLSANDNHPNTAAVCEKVVLSSQKDGEGLLGKLNESAVWDSGGYIETKENCPIGLLPDSKNMENEGNFRQGWAQVSPVHPSGDGGTEATEKNLTDFTIEKILKHTDSDKCLISSPLKEIPASADVMKIKNNISDHHKANPVQFDTAAPDESLVQAVESPCIGIDREIYKTLKNELPVLEDKSNERDILKVEVNYGACEKLGLDLPPSQISLQCSSVQNTPPNVTDFSNLLCSPPQENKKPTKKRKKSHSAEKNQEKSNKPGRKSKSKKQKFGICPMSSGYQYKYTGKQNDIFAVNSNLASHKTVDKSIHVEIHDDTLCENAPGSFQNPSCDDTASREKVPPLNESEFSCDKSLKRKLSTEMFFSSSDNTDKHTEVIGTLKAKRFHSDEKLKRPTVVNITPMERDLTLPPMSPYKSYDLTLIKALPNSDGSEKNLSVVFTDEEPMKHQSEDEIEPFIQSDSQNLGTETAIINNDLNQEIQSHNSDATQTIQICQAENHENYTTEERDTLQASDVDDSEPILNKILGDFYGVYPQDGDINAERRQKSPILSRKSYPSSRNRDLKISSSNIKEIQSNNHTRIVQKSSLISSSYTDPFSVKRKIVAYQPEDPAIFHTLLSEDQPSYLESQSTSVPDILKSNSSVLHSIYYSNTKNRAQEKMSFIERQFQYLTEEWSPMFKESCSVQNHDFPDSSTEDHDFNSGITDLSMVMKPKPICSISDSSDPIINSYTPDHNCTDSDLPSYCQSDTLEKQLAKPSENHDRGNLGLLNGLSDESSVETSKEIKSCSNHEVSESVQGSTESKNCSEANASTSNKKKAKHNKKDKRKDPDFEPRLKDKSKPLSKDSKESSVKTRKLKLKSKSRHFLRNTSCLTTASKFSKNPDANENFQYHKSHQTDLPLSLLTMQSQREFLKQSGESFVQDAPCCDIARMEDIETASSQFELQSWQECQECRNAKVKDSMAVFCRFYGYRKLKFRMNFLCVAGFLLPEECTSKDLELWMPQRRCFNKQRPIADKDILSPNDPMDRKMSDFILSNIAARFCHIVKIEEKAMSWINNDEIVFWKKPVPGVRDLCDVCETTLFNVHWICQKCGFGVCLDCYERRKSKSVEEQIVYDRDRRNCFRWLPCSKIECHYHANMIPTQIIPSTCLVDLSRRMHYICSKRNIHIACQCSAQKKQSKQAAKTKQGPAKKNIDTQSETREEKFPSVDSNPQNADVDQTEIKVKEGKLDGVNAGKLCNSLQPSICLVDLLGGTAWKKSNAEKSSTSTQCPATSEPSANEDASNEPDPAHQWLCHGRLLQLTDSQHPGNMKAFKNHWKDGMPVLVSGVGKYLNMDLWRPERLADEYGDEDSKNSLVNCLTGSVITNMKIRDFWDGFENISNRLLDEDNKTMILKLKDWPPTEAFHEVMPDMFQDLMHALPLPEYTFIGGMCNLASRLPHFFVKPDLGPKMYNAYGWVTETNWKQGTTNLHLDISDAVNVMVYVGIPEDEPEEARDRLMEIVKDGDVDEIQIQRAIDEKPGALWHIFHQRDVDKIREFIVNVCMERGESLAVDHDPIHDQQMYLDKELRQRLKLEFGVEGYGILQCEGDGVFIPAGAPHQVFNLHSCIKIAEDFVSPEHVDKCFTLTNEFRYLSSTHSNHEDKLQIKNIIYHAVKDIVSSAVHVHCLEKTSH